MFKIPGEKLIENMPQSERAAFLFWFLALLSGGVRNDEELKKIMSWGAGEDWLNVPMSSWPIRMAQRGIPVGPHPTLEETCTTLLTKFKEAFSGELEERGEINAEEELSESIQESQNYEEDSQRHPGISSTYEKPRLKKGRSL